MKVSQCEKQLGTQEVLVLPMIPAQYQMPETTPNLLLGLLDKSPNNAAKTKSKANAVRA